MTTSNGLRPEPSGPASRENWWTRIGTMGQTLTAVIGLVAALVPVLVKTGLPGQADGPTPQPIHVVRRRHPHRPNGLIRSTSPSPTSSPRARRRRSS